MDRYKFRGKPIGCDCKDFGMTDCGCCNDFDFPEEFYKDGFVYGRLVDDDVIALGIVETQDSAIVYEYWARVDPSTVGQYSTINLKDDTELYAGDLVQHETVKWIGVVEFKDGAFIVKTKHGTWQPNKLRAERLVKVGNVHDNPELLKGE